MWILKNSKFKSRDFSKIDCIKTYGFSTLYTIIPHDKLKSRLFQIIDNCNCFLNKNGTRKYKFLVIGKQDTYFVRNHSDCSHKYFEVDILKEHAWVSYRLYLCSLWRPCLPTICWYSYGHKLRPLIGSIIC